MERNNKHFRKREAILTCLRETKVHPSADWVYAQLKPKIPNLSLGTVYRNLALFKEQGLILSVGTVKGVERFDGNPDFHVHFICTECGCVRDLDWMPDLPGLTATAEKDSGSKISGCQLTFTGVCRECSQNQNKEEAV